MDKKLIVFDMDGTLSDTTHRMQWMETKPKNWVKFYENLHLDGAHDDIAELARTLAAAGHTIVICTGRPDYDRKLELDIREVTRVWLNKHNIPYEMLLMRNAGDYRPDDVVKLELLDIIHEVFGWPHLWFEDRSRVVKALREKGVRVLQVTEGDY